MRFNVEGILGQKVLDISGRLKKQIANAKLCKALKRVRSQERMAMIAELYIRLQVELPGEGEDMRRMLSWDEVHEMSGRGICFGAHTVYHPILSQDSLECGKSEILESKRRIQNKLGIEVRHFSIPNGSISDFTEEMKAFCGEIGMSTIVTTEYGIVRDRSDPLFLRRVSPKGPIWNFACELSKLFLFPSRYEAGADAFVGCESGGAV